MFGVFLFLTSTSSRRSATRRSAPGSPSCRWSASVVLAPSTSTTRHLPRVGPRPLVTSGWRSPRPGCCYLTGVGAHRLRDPRAPGPDRDGPRHRCMIMAPSMTSATAGVRPVRRRRGLGDGVDRPADRRLDRRRAAQHAAPRRRRRASSRPRRRRRPTMAEAAVHGYTTAFFGRPMIFGSARCWRKSSSPSGAPAAAPEGELVMAGSSKALITGARPWIAPGSRPGRRGGRSPSPRRPRRACGSGRRGPRPAGVDRGGVRRGGTRRATRAASSACRSSVGAPGPWRGG